MEGVVDMEYYENMTNQFSKKAQLRRESMIPTFLPKVGDPFLTIEFSCVENDEIETEIDDLINFFVIRVRKWKGDTLDWFEYYNGMIFAIDNRKGAKEWIVKYREAWRGL
jgi:hypothetical protein